MHAVTVTDVLDPNGGVAPPDAIMSMLASTALAQQGALGGASDDVGCASCGSPIRPLGWAPWAGLGGVQGTRGEQGCMLPAGCGHTAMVDWWYGSCSVRTVAKGHTHR